VTRRVFVHEVAPRDGLQIEPRFVPTEDKIAWIDALSRTGLAKIEVTSFTSPRAIPTLADADAVLRGIARVPGVTYAALVPNARGAERALAANVDELNVVMSASESHNQANLRMTSAQSLAQLAAIASLPRGKVINASLSTAFGCPFEGDVPAARVFDRVAAFVTLGITRITLCDTTGMANPAQVGTLCRQIANRWPELELTAHFHNTRGMGLANAAAALDAGVRRFDAALGGIGGCPFAPGASGNVCTEDLVHMLEAMGWDTGVDLDALLAITERMPALLGHDVEGQVRKAGPATRRHALPQSRDELA